MKQLILSIATLLIIGASTFAANNGDVNQKARQSFQKDFSTARNVRYEQKRDYVKITFSFNDQVLSAFYNDDGELLAVVRNVLSTELPIRLLTILKKDYDGFWISDLFEITASEQTTYYITLDNADRTIVLRSVDMNYWTAFSRVKKEM